MNRAIILFILLQPWGASANYYGWKKTVEKQKAAEEVQKKQDSERAAQQKNEEEATLKQIQQEEKTKKETIEKRDKEWAEQDAKKPAPENSAGGNRQDYARDAVDKAIEEQQRKRLEKLKKQ